MRIVRTVERFDHIAKEVAVDDIKWQCASYKQLGDGEMNFSVLNAAQYSNLSIVFALLASRSSSMFAYEVRDGALVHEWT